MGGGRGLKVYVKLYTFWLNVTWTIGMFIESNSFYLSLQPNKPIQKKMINRYFSTILLILTITEFSFSQISPPPQIA